MKKHILGLLSLFSILNSMDGPVVKAPQVVLPKHFDMWEFFSEPNNLDKLGEPVLVWNKKRIKDDCDINTLANLRILQRSNLQTKQKVILEVECERGNVSAFLAQNAHEVFGYADDSINIRQANSKYDQRNLMFYNNFSWSIPRENFQDIIISCSPTADLEKLQALRALLKPQGEIFYLFTTRSNTEPIEAQVLREIFSKIKKCVYCFEQQYLRAWVTEENKKYPSDETLKAMIAQSGFDIITFEQQNFNIMIQDMKAFKNFHKSLIMNLPFMKLITYPKNREKIANLFIGKMISKLKKVEPGNWIYPCSKTIVHIRKQNNI